MPATLAELLEATDPDAVESAWRRFVAEYSGVLIHAARSVAHDHDGVMDIYAHVLDQLREDDFRRLRAYLTDGPARFTTWLVIVARRMAVDLHRRRYGRVQSRDGTRSDALAERRRLAELVSVEVDLGQIRDLRGGPDIDLRRAELRHALGEVLAALEPRDRLLLWLRFGKGLSGREIAVATGFPSPFHVYRRINRLLRDARAALEARGVRDPEP